MKNKKGELVVQMRKKNAPGMSQTLVRDAGGDIVSRFRPSSPKNKE